jgi:hypothetical protein
LLTRDKYLYPGPGIEIPVCAEILEAREGARDSDRHEAASSIASVVIRWTNSTRLA